MREHMCTRDRCRRESEREDHCEQKPQQKTVHMCVCVCVVIFVRWLGAVRESPHYSHNQDASRSNGEQRRRRAQGCDVLGDRGAIWHQIRDKTMRKMRLINYDVRGARLTL